MALKSDGGRRWNPKVGYGFEVADGADEWKQWGGGPTARRPIRLLKLHGSLNWQRDGDAFNLLASPHERDSAEHAIVPPLGRKPVSKEPFLQAWRNARAAVKTAEPLVVVGYSLPPADYLTRALFRADLNGDRLREVIVADPDPNVGDRFLQLLTRAPRRSRRCAASGTWPTGCAATRLSPARAG